MTEPTRRREYTGPTQQAAWEAFQRDAAEAARHGWEPARHEWGPGVLLVTYRPTAAPPAAPVVAAIPPRQPEPAPVRPAPARKEPAPRKAPVDPEDALDSDDPEEVRLAIAQVRLRKQELGQAKRAVTAEIAAIRSEHSSRVAQRGSKVRGRGTLCRMARSYQTAQRDNDRRRVDDAVRPMVERREQIDAAIREVDALMLDLQQHLLELRS